MYLWDFQIFPSLKICVLVGPRYRFKSQNWNTGRSSDVFQILSSGKFHRLKFFQLPIEINVLQSFTQLIYIYIYIYIYTYTGAKDYSKFWGYLKGWYFFECRYRVITLPKSRYPLDPIQCIGMPKTNVETIATSSFCWRDTLGKRRERFHLLPNFSHPTLIGRMELFCRA